MAYVSTARLARGPLARLMALKDTVATAVRQRRVYLQTVAELNALTDRELADLGISRLAIAEIAHQAAYGI
ncbi:MAG: hypothetical protein B7Z10_07430 [Rhodobacterales bacterium 32-66-7]|nr:MAG: hypothetical protein B7Z31_05655 [Rhodobacterales bacterium 12-65-15]OYX25066.1 MAG: hypothetical protein B7Z10_07430 [Rhodobacterales bacterium 32-66-7]